MFRTIHDSWRPLHRWLSIAGYLDSRDYRPSARAMQWEQQQRVCKEWIWHRKKPETSASVRHCSVAISCSAGLTARGCQDLGHASHKQLLPRISFRPVILVKARSPEEIRRLSFRMCTRGTGWPQMSCDLSYYLCKPMSCIASSLCESREKRSK